jgi:hypothetical protein
LREEKKMERIKRIICFVCIFVLSGVSGMETYASYPVSGAKVANVSAEEQMVMDVVTADQGVLIDKQSADATRVLLVGNSFTKTEVSSSVTYSVEQPLKDMAAAEGRNLKVKTLAHGLARLKYYAGMDEEHISYYKQFIKLLVNRKWDYIIFQERTAEPIQYFESSTVPAIQRLQELVKVFQPQAKTLLYMNAGYSNGVPIKVNGKKKLLTTEEMELYLAAAFQELENRLGIEAVMVGMHSHRVNKLYPDICMVRDDDKHPEYAGYYLAACSFYYRIFRTLPYPWETSLTGSNLSEREISAIYHLPVDSLALNKKSVVLKKGKTQKLKAIISSRLPDSYEITYKSFDESVASVNPRTGLIKAKKEGQTIIYAESRDGLQAFCNVTVKMPLSFSRSYYMAGEGDRLWVKPLTNLDNLKWFSGKKKVATVNEATGLVKAKAPGKTVIKVFNKNKPSEKASYTLYVTCGVPKNVKASPSKSKTQGASYADIKISWNSVQGATSYEIYRSAKKNGKYQRIGTTKKLSFVDKTAAAKKNYYYKVAAKNKYEYCDSSLSKRVKARRKRLK